VLLKLTFCALQHLDSSILITARSKHGHLELRERAKWQIAYDFGDIMESKGILFHKLSTRSFAVESAVHAYERGLISLGRAAEIANLPYGKIMSILIERGVPLHLGAPVDIAEKRSKRLVERLNQLRST
jgi:predicted HTH domain antitoxin